MDLGVERFLKALNDPILLVRIAIELNVAFCSCIIGAWTLQFNRTDLKMVKLMQASPAPRLKLVICRVREASGGLSLNLKLPKRLTSLPNPSVAISIDTQFDLMSQLRQT
jgi:hypothetical protein